MMRVTIDRSICTGELNCMLIANAVFGISDEDGKGIVLTDPVDEKYRAAVTRAIAGCPVGAIRLIDENSSK